MIERVSERKKIEWASEKDGGRKRARIECVSHINTHTVCIRIYEQKLNRPNCQ